MWSFIWHTFFFDPVYNTLVFFIDIFPGGDVGLAIVATTLLVKTILLPVSVKATKTQVAMKEIEPKLKALKETHKDDRQKLAEEMMALYKSAGVNPFASILLVLLQIPIIIALYLSVVSGGGTALPGINEAVLYSFVAVPTVVSMLFLGVFDITAKSALLALIAGGAQFMHARLSPLNQKTEESEEEKKRPKTTGETLKADFQKSMQIQIKWVLPVIITVIAYTFGGAVALYFVVSNLFALAQEFYLRRLRS